MHRGHVYLHKSLCLSLHISQVCAVTTDPDIEPHGRESVTWTNSLTTYFLDCSLKFFLTVRPNNSTLKLKVTLRSSHLFLKIKDGTSVPEPWERNTGPPGVLPPLLRFHREEISLPAGTSQSTLVTS